MRLTTHLPDIAESRITLTLIVPERSPRCPKPPCPLSKPRLRMVEDRLEIYNLIAGHPPSADTGADYYTRAIYRKTVRSTSAAARPQAATRRWRPLAHRRAPGGDCRRSCALRRPAAHQYRRRIARWSCLTCRSDATSHRGAGCGPRPRHLAAAIVPTGRRQPLGARANRARLEDQAPHGALAGWQRTRARAAAHGAEGLRAGALRDAHHRDIHAMTTTAPRPLIGVSATREQPDDRRHRAYATAER
jgi:hypothetical protein